MKKPINKTFTLALSLVLMSSVFTPVIGAAASNDYQSHWAQATIQAALDKGTVTGYPDGSFKPDATITRAEFFQMINKEFNFTKEARPIYSDVAESAWYASTIAKANTAGYISGYMDGSIHPNDRITRQEVAVIVNRLRDLSGNTNVPSFADASAIPEWSRLAIIAAFESKIMMGYPDGSFMPDAQIKRAEALVTLNRLFSYRSPSAAQDLTYDAPGSYGPTEGTVTVTGDVMINVAGVTLSNAVVNGNLTIAKGVSGGDVTLKNVTVKGYTYVNGGAMDTIYLENVQADTVAVLKDAGLVKLVASGTSKIGNFITVSNATLEEKNLTGTGFEDVILDINAPIGTSLSLINVACDQANIKADGTTLNIDKTSVIDLLHVNGSDTKISGMGVISERVVTGLNAVFEETLLTSVSN